MFENFLKTTEGVMALSLIPKHLKYCLITSKVDTDTMFLIKQLSNQLFANYSFPINTNFESIKHVNFSGYNFENFELFHDRGPTFLSTFNCPRDVFRTPPNI